jgi:geranylgeranyl diphosphate synthase, type I
MWKLSPKKKPDRGGIDTAGIIESEMEELRNALEEDASLTRNGLDKEYPALYGAMDYAMKSGGKRLRPLLFLVACRALGVNTRSVMPIALAIETAHNFTLVHDDIEDGDETRRNAPTLWKKYGVPDAINTGDLMLLLSLTKVLESGIDDGRKMEIWRRFSQTLTEIVEGQAMEFSFRGRSDVKIGEYEKMATKKAGVFFGFALEAAAIVAGKDDGMREALCDFGTRMGLAFMVMDDVLNIIGDFEKYGKEIGGDIKEGKRTVMTIHFLEHCKPDEKATMLKILHKARDKVSEDEVRWAIGAMKKSGSVGYAQEYANGLVGTAMKRLKELKNDELKEKISGFVGLLVDRES